MIIGLIGLLPIVGLAILSLTATRPSNLGLNNGRLAACPTSPNCVSTQSEAEQHRMIPIRYSGSREEAIQRLKKAIATQPRMTIITEKENYLYAEVTSRIFRFVDDIEFYLDDQQKVIHFRSAARSGYSDFGVNRARMERICDEFAGVAAQSWRAWYDELAKPAWTPAPSTIGLIWAILYPIIILSFSVVFVQGFRRRLPGIVVIPFILNLIANLLFMPFFSGMRSICLATIDIVIVWGTILWMSIVIWKHSKWIALAQDTLFCLGVYRNNHSVEYRVDEQVNSSDFSLTSLLMASVFTEVLCKCTQFK